MRDLSWQFDEFQQVGRDYGNPAEVEIYDSTHADFRDVEAESKQVLDCLEVAAGDVLIDFGSGTGTFAMAAARRCVRVHAVDVSQAMINYAKAKASSAGIANSIFLLLRDFSPTNATSRQQRSPRHLLSITCPTSGRESLWRECTAC